MFSWWVDPSPSSASSKGSNTRACWSQRDCSKLVEDVVVQGITVLKRTVLRPVLQVVLRVLAVDLGDRRRFERSITKRLGKDIRIHIGLWHLLPICRDRDERNWSCEVEHVTDYVRHVYEVAIVGALKKQVKFESKLKMSARFTIPIVSGISLCIAQGWYQIK
jgi:hypothetical protein